MGFSMIITMLINIIIIITLTCNGRSDKTFTEKYDIKRYQLFKYSRTKTAASIGTEI